MKGSAPTSVITDGDLAMKNAIKWVLPNSHHRLCTRHLIRNATSNFGTQASLLNSRNEVQDDFKSAHGVPVMNTSFASLGKLANKYFTREVFRVFRFVLERASHVKVVRVLVYQDVSEIPRSLVHDRWSKDAKLGFRSVSTDGTNLCDPQLTARRSGEDVVQPNVNPTMGDPVRARTKGVGGGSSQPMNSTRTAFIDGEDAKEVSGQSENSMETSHMTRTQEGNNS
ncbi:MULE transposase domain [Sesbania bispinosa]|nr:MULE transposase domain [Sesbania bispinosa]